VPLRMKGHHATEKPFSFSRERSIVHASHAFFATMEFTEDFQVFGLGVFCSQHQRCDMNEYLRNRPGKDLPRWDDDGSTRSRTLDDRMMSPVIAGLLFTSSLPP